MTVTYHPLLVAVSCLVAVVTAYAALDLTERAGAADGSARGMWLLGGGLAIGVGIWSMHFTGMLAVHVRQGSTVVLMAYDVPRLLWSLLVPIVASVLVVAVVSRRPPSRATLGVAGCLMGGGIAAMHYIGMSAARIAADVRHGQALVGASLVVAVSTSVGGLALALPRGSAMREVPPARRAAAAAMLAVAIAGTHYTAMASMRLQPAPFLQPDPRASVLVANTGLGVAAVTGALLLLGFSLLGVALDRRRRTRLAAFTALRALYESAEEARAETARATELLQDQALELEQQLEAVRTLAIQNEVLLAEAQASEMRFRGLVEAAYEGVWALDAVGDTTYVNPRMCGLLGIDAHDAVGRSFFEFLDPPSAFEARTRFARPQRGLVDSQELRFCRPDGGALDGRVVISPLTDANGDVSGVLVLVHDATEQLRAEAALRESEARFRELFERSPLPMWVYDLESLAFLDVNEAAVRHYGWSRDEFLGMTVDDVRPPEHRRLAARSVVPGRSASARDHRSYDRVVHRTKAGRRCEVEVASDAVTIDGRTAGLALLNDVTERLAAERALEENNERFEYILRATNDVIWDRDLATGTVVWSGGLHTAFRYPPGERAHTPDWWLAHVHPEDREEVLGSVQRELLEGGSVWDAEYRFRRGDGTYAHILDRGYILRDADGHPIRLIGAMQDVSEREALAARLRQAQRMETVGRLAGGIAHDFNNLLTVISANTEFARADLPSDSPVLRDLDEVLGAARRAEALTRQLLTFSRKQVWQPRLVDVNRTVGGLHRMLERLIGEDVRLTTRLCPTIWPVQVDPGQLEQVLANLVVNARDAMPGGGQIEIATATLALDAVTLRTFGDGPDSLAQPVLASLTPGDYVALSVRDDGVGIARDVLPHLFEPFFTTKAEGEGTGLGLATVYGVVQQAGGACHVDSRLGIGTRVTVLLPRDHTSDPAAAAPEAAPASAPGGRETVLVVEDEPKVRAVIHRLLTRAGYAVLQAGNGEEALTIWRQHRERGAPIDAVLTDAVMPLLGGHALAERLRGEAPDVRIVLMSGYTTEAAGGDAALARGAASAFVHKPLTGDALLTTLRTVIDS